MTPMPDNLAVERLAELLVKGPAWDKVSSREVATYLLTHGLTFARQEPNQATLDGMRECFLRIERWARWGRNLPDEAALGVAREAIARPEVQAEIQRLNAVDFGPPEGGKLVE